MKGKQSRKPFPKQSLSKSSEKLQLIHVDLCGPMSEPSFGGARYLLMFTDDYSRKTFGYLLKEKSDNFQSFVDFKRMVENQTGLTIKRIRLDNGTEFCNSKFDSFLKAHGIVHETTVPYSSPQLGVAERANRTVVEKSRCMLEEEGLSKRYWGEAVSTAIYLKNRSPTSTLKRLVGKRTNLSHLRVFRSKAYAHIRDVKRRKLDAKSKA